MQCAARAGLAGLTKSALPGPRPARRRRRAGLRRPRANPDPGERLADAALAKTATYLMRRCQKAGLIWCGVEGLPKLAAATPATRYPLSAIRRRLCAPGTRCGTCLPDPAARPAT